MATYSGKKIRKFNRAQMIFHWAYGVSWILLVLTGAIFLWRADPQSTATGLGPMLQGTFGQYARFLHRVAAVVMMLSPVIWILGTPKGALNDLKELFHFRKDDMKYMLIAPLHYTVGKPALPPQGRYNGGHKVNFYVVVLTFVGFVVSGLYMWFGRGIITDETFKLMQIIHSVSFWGGLAMGLLHIYLTMIHPFTSRSLSAMVSGWVELDYAAAEHALWVEQSMKNGTAEIIEEGKPAS
ncbi:MAG: formate dehydrogenase subunit gamma [Bacillota bacterium]